MESAIDRDDAEQLSGARELWEVVQVFKGYRQRRDGAVREVTIEVLKGAAGFIVEAQDSEGRQATGNPQPTVREAFRLTHWRDLDKP